MDVQEAYKNNRGSRNTQSERVLRPRNLNRALLERQLLLRRSAMSVPDALEQLAGLQTQAPNPPYIGLWSRLAGFRHEALSRLIVDKSAVRIALMRSTLHLVSARDCLTFRPVLQPVLERGLQSAYGKHLNGLDADALAAAGRALVEAQPRTFSELGALLAERWPDREPAALAAAVRTWVPLVQVPPRGVWGASGQASHTSAEEWLSLPLAADTAPDAMILRYLSAFGPATVKDMQVWSGLTRLSEVVRRLRPQLRTFRDEHGSELFDLPDAPLPDADTPAPVRFLSEFDNMLLSYADRTRIMAEEYRARVFTVNGIIRAAILVDGFVRGIWKIELMKDAAVLVIELFEPLSSQDREALIEEGGRLLTFAAAEAQSHDIRFT
ncbi:winged helix DNA-binding domain-containing protein [Paenibacillus sedimenti]|uniref:AlkZ family DNA glycosylase n=1 Tax=Paenibacillus sedimenti TaxID=2770274 RepID=A0A926QMD5_9BACL|nr:winged helix DNA-binding domain-containing protein [Paenibacillus sedimenti]MBD0383818.1 AlkZ family DNA glycosylase [Paenibacillus sedimenti]